MKYLYFILLILLFINCPGFYIHHTALRDINLGMPKDSVEQILEGSYIRRAARITENGENEELWQVKISEDYGRYLKSKKGKYKIESSSETKIEKNPLYWFLFKDNKLYQWGHIGDWGTTREKDYYFYIESNQSGGSKEEK